MSEGVGSDIFCNSCIHRAFFDNSLHASRRKAQVVLFSYALLMAYKERRIHIGALFFVSIYGSPGSLREKYHANFIAFSSNGKFIGMFPDIVAIEPCSLGNTDAG